MWYRRCGGQGPLLTAAALAPGPRSAETSTTRVQKDYFDTSFGPFYRTQQVILSTNDGASSIVSYANLQTVFYFLGNISNIAVVRAELLAPPPQPLRAPKHRWWLGGGTRRRTTMAMK
jgi:hypothetical protein